MAQYLFKCKCGETKEVSMKISEFIYIICEKCNETMKAVPAAVPNVGPKSKGRWGKV